MHGYTASVLKVSRSQDSLPYSRYTTFQPLNIPLARLKSLVPPEIAHSSIISDRTFFMTLACRMGFLWITTNSNQSWRNYHKTIQFSVRPGPITEVHTLWILNALWCHYICIGRQTPWTSQIQPWPQMCKEKTIKHEFI